ncbi:hypothetical protein BS50DRAFT_567735 [Corynespora cassiicola Philippines]|uniref:Uncharacterized protein n=1 Tax=Corynespora cassiicola Philippines TaxID=1448308 RepID=A0A2T2PBG4_CORCC|nr:hypothetical protein BS50DRAFT_567735 [Corynespora cassiicola Philippines]
MQKIKKVVHGHRKSTDATHEGDKSAFEPTRGATSGDFGGEGNHLQGSHQLGKGKQPASVPEPHTPIYDQFTGRSRPNTAAEQQETEMPPHFSNAADLKQSPPDSAKSFDSPSSKGPSSPISLRPDRAHARQTNFSEDASTASIKSGVMGFPQGNTDTHAAMGKYSPTSPTSRSGMQDQSEIPYHSERDKGLAAGVAGASGTTAHESTSEPLQPPPGRQTEIASNPKSGHSAQTTGQDGSHMSQSSAVPATGSHESSDWGKSTALALGAAGAGGYTAHEANSRRQNEIPKSRTEQPFERSFGEAEEVNDTSRSFPLSGGVISQPSHSKPATNERQPGTKDKEVGVDEGKGRQGLAGAAAAAATYSVFPHEKKRDTRPNENPASTSHNHDALAAAKAAAAIPLVKDASEQKHEPVGSASNAHERRPAPARYRTEDIHIPGEFPDPTPVEEAPEPAYIPENDSTSAAGSHELRHTGTLDHPQTKAEGTSPEHHYGRDAVIVGGVGAAGVGAYAAGKNLQDVPEGQEIFPTEHNPYSSTKIDPRVDSRSSNLKDDSIGKNHGHGTGLTQVDTSGVEPKDEKSDHHYGRNAALAGAGAATAGGLYYASKRDDKQDTGPASSTIGPHKSNIANIVDPRVQPQPEKQKGHVTAGPHESDMLNRADPKVDHKTQPESQHHYGRDAAIGAGVGAAGYGAYEATKGYAEHRSTQPAASMDEQRYDTHAPGAHDPTTAFANQTYNHNKHSEHEHDRNASMGAGVGVGAGALAYAGSKDNQKVQDAYTVQEQRFGSAQPGYQNQPQSSQYQGAQDFQQHPQHHYGRDAAIAGGLGAAGAGAYAATRGNQQQPAYEAQQPTISGHQRYDSVQDPSQHDKRNTAALGAAGVVGAGAYAYSQHDADQERLANQKAKEKELEHARKEQQKELDRRQKEFDQKQKEIEQHQAKEQKHHNKLVAAENKAHQKEIEQEQKRQQEAEKSEDSEEGKEKKHRLFGFLHRDKKDKDRDSTEDSPRMSGDNSESPRYSRELAGGAGSATAYDSSENGSDGRRGRNKLHKDPPKGHPAREVLEQQQKQHPHPHMGIDGPIGADHAVTDDAHV